MVETVLLCMFMMFDDFETTSINNVPEIAANASNANVWHGADSWYVNSQAISNISGKRVSHSLTHFSIYDSPIEISFDYQYNASGNQAQAGYAVYGWNNNTIDLQTSTPIGDSLIGPTLLPEGSGYISDSSSILEYDYVGIYFTQTTSNPPSSTSTLKINNVSMIPECPCIYMLLIPLFFIGKRNGWRKRK